LKLLQVDDVDKNDMPLDETNNIQPQDQEQSSSSEVVPPKKGREKVQYLIFLVNCTRLKKQNSSYP